MELLREGNPVHELARKRFSPKAFTSRPVPRREVRALFESARWSPSSFNDQPWSFVVATHEQPEAFGPLLAAASAKNAAWAKDAPVLVLAVTRLAFSHNGKPNRHALYDLGQSVAWLTVEATARGLLVHQMAGFDAQKAAVAVGLPEGWEAVTLMAIGYSEESPAATRSRQALDSMVFDGRFGEPLFG